MYKWGYWHRHCVVVQRRHRTVYMYIYLDCDQFSFWNGAQKIGCVLCSNFVCTSMRFNSMIHIRSFYILPKALLNQNSCFTDTFRKRFLEQSRTMPFISSPQPRTPWLGLSVGLQTDLLCWSALRNERFRPNCFWLLWSSWTIKIFL